MTPQDGAVALQQSDPAPRPRPHDRIYAQLTDDPDDLIGHIAYSLYKRNKVAYIESIVRDHVREPTQEETENFRRQASLAQSITSLRLEAETVLSQFTTEVLSVEMSDAEGRFQNQLTERLGEAQPFWRGVGQNILASIVTVAIFALIMVVIWGMKYGVQDVIERVFNVTISPNR